MNSIFTKTLEFTANSSLAYYNFLSEIVIYEEDVLFTTPSNLDPAKAARCDGIGTNILKI